MNIEILEKGNSLNLDIASKSKSGEFKKLKNVKNYQSDSNEIWVYE